MAAIVKLWLRMVGIHKLQRKLLAHPAAPREGYIQQSCNYQHKKYYICPFCGQNLKTESIDHYSSHFICECGRLDLIING